MNQVTGPPPSPPTRPGRNGSRNGSSPAGPPTVTPAVPTAARSVATCPLCAAPLPSARARYCSAACRQQAFRLRHAHSHAHSETAALTDLAALRHALQRQRALVAHTVYECPRCEARYVGERRCPECHVFCRALGLGGHCPDCDQPVLLVELLGGALFGKEVCPSPTST